MADYAYVSLTLNIDLGQARELGLDIPVDNEVEYAKDEFMDFIHNLRDTDIWENLEVELE